MRYAGRATLALARRRKLEMLRKLCIETVGFALLIVFPFSLLFGVLLIAGARWWVAAPVAYIFIPFFRSLLFGPPCGRCRRKRISLSHPCTWPKSLRCPKTTRAAGWPKRNDKSLLRSYADVTANGRHSRHQK